MRYSKEFKLICLELYKQGRYPETPDNISTGSFHRMVRKWVRTAECCGFEALEHKSQNRKWTPEEKLELIQNVLNGGSCQSVAIENGINSGMLYGWVRRYRLYGYEGLVSKQGRKPKESTLERKHIPADLTESEREELIRLRAEAARMRTEIAAIKKEIALREEQGKARLKAKKQRSLKNSTKKDTN